jgi:hypothetical protein
MPLSAAQLAALDAAAAQLGVDLNTLNAALATLVADSTTTPPPPPPPSGSGPTVPSTLAGVPNVLIFSDSFATLNETVWSPTWFGNTEPQNDTNMDAANVTIGPDGLHLLLSGKQTGAIVSSNPSDGQPGHVGIAFDVTKGNVYTEWLATLPASPSNPAQLANIWAALWQTGQTWPATGEMDLLETFGQTCQFHAINADGNPGGTGGTSMVGQHRFGALWTPSGVTYVYDGKVVSGSNVASQVIPGPLYLVAENSMVSGPSGAGSDLGSVVVVRSVSVWQGTGPA